MLCPSSCGTRRDGACSSPDRGQVRCTDQVRGRTEGVVAATYLLKWHDLGVGSRLGRPCVMGLLLEVMLPSSR